MYEQFDSVYYVSLGDLIASRSIIYYKVKSNCLKYDPGIYTYGVDICKHNIINYNNM